MKTRTPKLFVPSESTSSKAEPASEKCQDQPKLDRDFLANLLRECAIELANSYGSTIFTAPLAFLFRSKLRRALGDPDVQFNGRLFGPILFDQLSDSEHSNLKFRDFLVAFPDLVHVIPHPHGDQAKVLVGNEVARVDHLTAEYSTSLIRILRELTRYNPNSWIPATQLAKRLKKRHAKFDPKKLGYSSLLKWLESLNDEIEIADRETGGKVRFRSATDHPLYLLVNGPDVLLHVARPDWRAIYHFVRTRFPENEIKARYFTVKPPSGQISLQFVKYLEKAGFTVVILAPEPTKDFRETSANAIKSMLEALVAKEAHVIVVGHGDYLAESIKPMLKDQRTIGVIGLRNSISKTVLKLESSGLLTFDLKKDVQMSIPSNSDVEVVLPSTFDPKCYL